MHAGGRVGGGPAVPPPPPPPPRSVPPFPAAPPNPAPASAPAPASQAPGGGTSASQVYGADMSGDGSGIVSSAPEVGAPAPSSAAAQPPAALPPAPQPVTQPQSTAPQPVMAQPGMMLQQLLLAQQIAAMNAAAAAAAGGAHSTVAAASHAPSTAAPSYAPAPAPAPAAATTTDGSGAGNVGMMGGVGGGANPLAALLAAQPHANQLAYLSSLLPAFYQQAAVAAAAAAAAAAATHGSATVPAAAAAAAGAAAAGGDATAAAPAAVTGSGAQTVQQQVQPHAPAPTLLGSAPSVSALPSVVMATPAALPPSGLLPVSGMHAAPSGLHPFDARHPGGLNPASAASGMGTQVVAAPSLPAAVTPRTATTGGGDGGGGSTPPTAVAATASAPVNARRTQFVQVAVPAVAGSGSNGSPSCGRYGGSSGAAGASVATSSSGAGLTVTLPSGVAFDKQAASAQPMTVFTPPGIQFTPTGNVQCAWSAGVGSVDALAGRNAAQEDGVLRAPPTATLRPIVATAPSRSTAASSVAAGNTQAAVTYRIRGLHLSADAPPSGHDMEVDTPVAASPPVAPTQLQLTTGGVLTCAPGVQGDGGLASSAAAAVAQADVAAVQEAVGATSSRYGQPKYRPPITRAFAQASALVLPTNETQAVFLPPDGLPIPVGGKGQPPVSYFTRGMKPPATTPSGRPHALHADAVMTLKVWFARHWAQPYPTATERDTLARNTGLSASQVSDWFRNERRRHLPLDTQKPAERDALHVAEVARRWAALGTRAPDVPSDAAGALAAVDAQSSTLQPSAWSAFAALTATAHSGSAAPYTVLHADENGMLGGQMMMTRGGAPLACPRDSLLLPDGRMLVPMRCLPPGAVPLTSTVRVPAAVTRLPDDGNAPAPHAPQAHAVRGRRAAAKAHVIQERALADAHRQLASHIAQLEKSSKASRNAAKVGGGGGSGSGSGVGGSSASRGELAISTSNSTTPEPLSGGANMPVVITPIAESVLPPRKRKRAESVQVPDADEGSGAQRGSSGKASGPAASAAAVSGPRAGEGSKSAAAPTSAAVGGDNGDTKSRSGSIGGLSDPGDTHSLSWALLPLAHTCGVPPLPHGMQPVNADGSVPTGAEYVVIPTRSSLLVARVLPSDDAEPSPLYVPIGTLGESHNPAAYGSVEELVHEAVAHDFAADVGSLFTFYPPVDSDAGFELFEMEAAAARRGRSFTAGSLGGYSHFEIEVVPNEATAAGQPPRLFIVEGGGGSGSGSGGGGGSGMTGDGGEAAEGGVYSLTHAGGRRFSIDLDLNALRHLAASPSHLLALPLSHSPAVGGMGMDAVLSGRASRGEDDSATTGADADASMSAAAAAVADPEPAHVPTPSDEHHGSVGVPPPRPASATSAGGGGGSGGGGGLPSTPGRDAARPASREASGAPSQTVGGTSPNLPSSGTRPRSSTSSVGGMGDLDVDAFPSFH